MSNSKGDSYGDWSAIDQANQDAADPGGFLHEASWKQKPDMPPPPDYIGAARTQAMGSIGANIANNLSSQQDTYSPLGSQTYQQIGSTKLNIPGVGEVDIPRYRQDIRLSPEQQALYGGQTALQGGLLGQSYDSLSKPFDMQGVNDVADRAYGAITDRLDPMWTQREAQQKTQLANQGLVPGGEAYTNAMRDFNMGRNDAYQNANLAALQTMPQTMQMAQGLRDMPLNEMNALKSGSPVSMPQFQPTQFAQGAQGPNTLAATGQQAAWQQAMYNSQIQAQNSQTQGLMGLGGAALAAFMSDRRLKTNVVRVGTHPLGIGIYEYDMFGVRERGVMADEVEIVMPQAVTEVLGFKAVYYGML